jgi:hypothetical protein
MNQENQNNAKMISEVLKLEFETVEKGDVNILDVCCGAYDQAGTNYDEKGDIYQPVVADNLARLGFAVTGIDFRESGYWEKSKSKDQNSKIEEGDLQISATTVLPSDGINTNLKYTHRSDINIVQENWSENLSKDWNVLIFLRSWDTPEILLHYQKVLDIDDLNLLSLEIAKIYLPIFAELLLPGGLFFTTDICNLALCDDSFEIQLYQNQVKQLIHQNGFNFIEQKDGLHWFKKKF